MSLPLFREYPALRNSLPVVSLLDAPTPIEHFATNLWVKRDDKTSAVYGGNKVRKLEFVLADVVASNKRRVVTFGAYGTNHGVATSAFCQRHGIACTVLLFDQPVTPTVLANLKQMIANGAQLVVTGSLAKTALQFYARSMFKRSDYCLPAGGSSPLGCLGFVNAAFELREQIAQGLLPEPDYIVCAVGSSGTVAGLTLGCRLAGLKTQVKGIRVAPSHLGPVPICTRGSATRLMARTYQALTSRVADIPSVVLPDIELSDAFYGAGYGCATGEGAQATAAFEQQGIALDATYTAKAAAAALQLCEKVPDAQVLYWHTFCQPDTTLTLSAAQLEQQSEAVLNILHAGN